MDPTVPPLTPDQATAQRWAEEELAKEAYADGDRTNGQAFFDWLEDFIDGLLSPSVGSVPVVWIVVAAVAVAVLVLVAVYLLGPARKARDRSRASAAVLDDDTRSAAAIRAAAKDAAEAGRWDDAVLDCFRAIIRGFEERSVIDERAGRTAYEAARDSGRSLPSHADELRDGSHLFDAVCYGHRAATRADYESLAALEAATRDARKPVGAGL